MADLTIETIAAAIAKANNHPEPDFYAASVAAHFNDTPQPIDPNAPNEEAPAEPQASEETTA